jgi:hypothetical protein
MRAWHIVGDSHITAFRYAAEHKLLDFPAHFTEVGGATAVGLRNPNAMTNALELFRAALLPAKSDATPVIQLGEVDCGFVIWYRASKYGESVELQLNESIDSYFEFVDGLIDQGYRRIVISAATLPTIRDGQDWGEVANARREVTATLAQRTALTFAYNDRLRAQAARRALAFIDITQDVLDPQTGVIAESFRHPDPTDHHLDPAKIAMLWAEELRRVSRSWE